MGCLHQRGSVNPALPWQAARSSCFLLTLLPGCLRWKCTAWLECCFAWHFSVTLSRRVTQCWGEPKGSERVKMHLEPATNAQRTKPRLQVFQQALNTSPHCQGTRTRMGSSTLSGRMGMMRSQGWEGMGGSQNTNGNWKGHAGGVYVVFAGGPCSVLQAKRKPEEHDGHQAQEGEELLFPPMKLFTVCRDIIK